MSDTVTGQLAKPNNPPLQTPFASIALALSGGGFRAASFSLGTLSYLNAVEYSAGKSLLNNVHFISSASGGTITNATYALATFAGQSFPEFYKRLHHLLSGEALLKEALEILNNDSEWEEAGAPDGGKTRTLINAFAKVYDRKLFDHATLGDIWFAQGKPTLSVCFNATEFYKGMSFRFQTPADEKDKGLWGNQYLFIDKAHEAAYKKIKLGDVLAASSCFPAGFEPILYPRDFSYQATGSRPGLGKQELMDAGRVGEYDETRKPLDKTVAMMDGGIADNQGLYSAMVADNRERRNGHGFDLIMSTDVASYFMDPYNPPEEKPAKGWRGKNLSYYINTVKKALATVKTFLIVAILLLVAGVVTALNTTLPTLAIAGWVLSGVALTVLIVTFFVLRKAKGNAIIQSLTSHSANDDIRGLLDSVNAGGNFSPSIIDMLSYYLSRTKLNALELMVKARLTSVITMVMDINLKQVRRLIYELLYSNEKWENRRRQNAIYDMSTYNKSNRRFRIEKKTVPAFTPEEQTILLEGCEAIEKVGEEARNMGTTLWFDDKDDEGQMLKKIISCGHFTTCGNLLEYVMTIQKKGLPFTPDVTQQLQNIRQQLEGHWQQFKANPYFLYEQTASS